MANSKKSLKIGSLSPVGMMVIAAVATLAAVPLRTFQLTNLIDPETGFWLSRDLTVPILYILTAVVLVLSFFLTLLSGTLSKPTFPEKRSVPMGVVSLLAAVAFAYENVTLLMGSIRSIQNYRAGGFALSGSYLMSSGIGPSLLQAVFGLLAALYLMIVAICLFQGNGAYKKSRILALSPVLWAIFRLMVQFVNPIRYQNVSQLLFEIIFLCFAMIFFLSFARLASGVNENSSMWVLYFSGIASAFVGFIVALAPFALLVTGKSAYICPSYPMSFAILAYSLFATGVLMFNMPVTIPADDAGEDFVADADSAEAAATDVAGRTTGGMPEKMELADEFSAKPVLPAE